jgi:hypothetical protein
VKAHVLIKMTRATISTSSVAAFLQHVLTSRLLAETIGINRSLCSQVTEAITETNKLCADSEANADSVRTARTNIYLQIFRAMTPDDQIIKADVPLQNTVHPASSKGVGV